MNDSFETVLAYDIFVTCGAISSIVIFLEIISLLKFYFMKKREIIIFNSLSTI